MSSTAEVDRVRDRLRERAGKGAAIRKATREPVTSVAKVEAARSRKNSRTKGNRAELDVAAMFSRWCGETVRRTPLSGGWSSARFGVTADLVCPNPAFPFSCEIKHRNGWTLDDLVTGARRDHDRSIVQWWMQCVEQCPKTKTRSIGSARGDDFFLKDPLLVFRRDRQPWLVMARDRGDVYATGQVHVRMPDVHQSAQSVVVVLLETFLGTLSVPEGLANHRNEARRR